MASHDLCDCPCELQDVPEEVSNQGEKIVLYQVGLVWRSALIDLEGMKPTQKKTVRVDSQSESSEIKSRMLVSRD